MALSAQQSADAPAVQLRDAVEPPVEAAENPTQESVDRMDDGQADRPAGDRAGNEIGRRNEPFHATFVRYLQRLREELRPPAHGRGAAEDAEDPPRQRLALRVAAAFSVLKIATARAGVSVIALMAEMTIDAAIVKANCR